MFTTYTLAALLALTAPLAARADVAPDAPGPGDSFTVGQTCHIAWSGDTASTTAWKGMAIELMSGPNLDMNHITTVATNQDGTTAGTFDFPCPSVTPNSAIYFYQFSAAGSPDKTWTTRFTIAAATGETTPPANATQPGTNAAIPWGVGALVDPSQAVAAPAFAADTGSSGSGPTGTTGTTAATTPTTAATTPTLTKITTPAPAATNLASTTATGNSTAGNSTSADTKGSGAAPLTLSSAHIWLSALAVVFAVCAW